MRRKDREITDRNEIELIIEKSTVCRLAMADDSGPYIVPLCFGFRNNTLYFHSAAEGKKLGFLRKNPRVCFELDCDTEVRTGGKACDFSMRYRSVIGSECRFCRGDGRQTRGPGHHHEPLCRGGV